MQMAKVLIVEDDEKLLNLLRETLTHNHFQVETATNGSEGSDLLRFYKYDVVILDIDLPEITGTEICLTHRRSGGTTPILMLTGKSTIDDKERGFDVGADDYLTKPFDVRELLVRIRALLRRAEGGTTNVLTVGDLQLDAKLYRVTRNGIEIHLSRTDFALLEFLMRHPDEVFSPEALLDRVWMSGSDSTPQALYSSLKRVRKKIDNGSSESLIKSVHGFGYCLSSSGTKDKSEG